MMMATAAFSVTAATVASLVHVSRAAPSADVLGPAELIYDWRREHCANGLEGWQWDVPDMPARMWRRRNNETTLIASSNLGSRANIGPDPDHLQHTCDVYVPQRPAAYM